MSLRNQPYFPLYVQDFLTDEKLNCCSASSQGVYIKIMCLLHKSEVYGELMLKQKDKQNKSTIKNFAVKLSRLLPFDNETIDTALIELLEEGVLCIEGDVLYQKRMRKDGEISELRSKSAKSGGGNPALKTNKKDDLHKQNSKQNKEQKDKQNTEYEIEYEFESVSVFEKGGVGEKTFDIPDDSPLPVARKRQTGIKPELHEAQIYFIELGRLDQADKFFDYYESNGWKVGRNPMKDWKAAARRWASQSAEFKRSDQNKPDRFQELGKKMALVAQGQFINNDSEAKQLG
ncbi:MAG TPA: hypothetical protein PLD32_13180 [Saprospiraceae bacterium]|nr:hypothetical protein [Saprospiraceae bacterium]HNC37513.1 hypothetical protein [Saprospiraceae bacterium]HNG70243.1 hypothetical protein [Saprospiraceae bacterium]